VTVHLDEGIVLPRRAVRFPIELHRPPGMRVEDPDTWPRVDGRLEYLGGRLLYTRHAPTSNRTWRRTPFTCFAPGPSRTRSSWWVVIDAASERRYATGERLAERAELPGLSPEVDRLFAQLRR
jgi:hypothetical protein